MLHPMGHIGAVGILIQSLERLPRLFYDDNLATSLTDGSIG